MKLPTQVQGVERLDRAAQAAEMKAAGINPALFGLNIGDLLKKGIGFANKLANG